MKFGLFGGAQAVPGEVITEAALGYHEYGEYIQAVVVPWHNPVLLAEQVATIDQLSRGRYDFGVGRGYRANEYHGFGLEMADGQDIFEESINFMRRAFTETERWSYESDRYTFNDIIVEPPVVQKPHPPMWVGAASEGSIRGAARNGYNLLLAQVPSFETIAESVNFYRDELDKMGEEFDPYRIAVTRGLMVANDDGVIRPRRRKPVRSSATPRK